MTPSVSCNGSSTSIENFDLKASFLAMTFVRSTTHGDGILPDNGTRNMRDCCKDSSNDRRTNRPRTFPNGSAALMSRSPPRKIADGSDDPTLLVRWPPLADPLACLSLFSNKTTAQRPKKGQGTGTWPGLLREQPRPLPPLPHTGQISAPPHPVTLPKRHRPANRRFVPRHPFHVLQRLSLKTLTLPWTLLIGRKRRPANTRLCPPKGNIASACKRLPRNITKRLRKGLLVPD